MNALTKSATKPVSIICVYNNPQVLQGCLQRSVDALIAEAPQTELIAVDNTAHAFASAGAALNHGAGLAAHDYLVFAHQDVYLHSLTALEQAAGLLAEHPEIGILGAVGITHDGRVIGRMRDRVELLGESLSEPTDIDSLDEVMFMIPRAVLDREPLAERPELAWHAYAVEYGLRVRAQGLRAAAIDLPHTHNSLTINLDRLDVAHRAVGSQYPQLLPVRTTCGVIRPAQRKVPGAQLLRPHRWRYTWLRESMKTRRARAAIGEVPFVLADIRLDIDEVLAQVHPMTIINYAGERGFADQAAGPTELNRIDRAVTVQSVDAAGLRAAVAGRARDESMLLTNLELGELESVAALLSPADTIVGFHGQLWILLGPATTAVPAHWYERRARPLGARHPLRRN